jgi:gamma-glutamylcyclotransferase (GGCT)/AIG2-like uncharacterized protein YtfP
VKAKQVSKPQSHEPNSILFVYGSLLDAAHRSEIIGREVDTVPATIRGYERGRGRYFYLRKRRGSATAGLLLVGLTQADFAILDAYEEIPLLYTREQADVTDGDGAALRCWIYLPTARALGHD